MSYLTNCHLSNWIGGRKFLPLWLTAICHQKSESASLLFLPNCDLSKWIGGCKFFLSVLATKKRPDGATCVFLSTWEPCKLFLTLSWKFLPPSMFWSRSVGPATPPCSSGYLGRYGLGLDAAPARWKYVNGCTIRYYLRTLPYQREAGQRSNLVDASACWHGLLYYGVQLKVSHREIGIEK